MELPLFYAPPDSFDGELIALPAAESHHAVNVMRLKKGDRLIVVDGLGVAYVGNITGVERRGKAVRVRVCQKILHYGEPSVTLTLAAGLSTGSKFDTVIEKGTELGVKAFVPVISERSKVKLNDPEHSLARVRRLERVALATIKQCRRSYRPCVSAPVSLEMFLRRTDPDAVKLLFHPGPSACRLDQVPWRRLPGRVVVLVGPESGFSPEEVARSEQAGFIRVGLGQRILRAETAGPVACALVMHELGALR